VLDVATEAEPAKEKLVSTREAEWILRTPFQVQADFFAERPEHGGISQLQRNFVQERVGAEVPVG
jgi:hypothetical protein